MSSLSVNNNQDNDVNDNHFQDMTTFKAAQWDFEIDLCVVIVEIYDLSDLLKGLWTFVLTLGRVFVDVMRCVILQNNICLYLQFGT